MQLAPLGTVGDNPPPAFKVHAAEAEAARCTQARADCALSMKRLSTVSDGILSPSVCVAHLLISTAIATMHCTGKGCEPNERAPTLHSMVCVRDSDQTKVR